MCKTKPTDKIPNGLYCYDEHGVCPYWSLNPLKPKQENGHCAYLGYGDWEVEDCVPLLWDGIKECGIKTDDSDIGLEE